MNLSTLCPQREGYKALTALHTATNPPLFFSSTALLDGLLRIAPHWMCGRSLKVSSLIDQSPFQSPPQTSPCLRADVPRTCQKSGAADHLRRAQMMSTAKP